MTPSYDSSRIEELAYKWDQGILTDAESTELNNWYASFSDDLLELPQAIDDDPIKIRDRMHHQLLANVRADRSAPFRLWPLIAVAASLLIVFFCAELFYAHQQKHADPSATLAENDVRPGQQNATLTLANGKKIRLLDAVNGELAKEDGVVISKTAEGRIGYQAHAGAGSPVELNTLTTANGETYSVTLPDQTVVWLNAASSLTYPSSFSGDKQRKVTLTGEAYFEVAKDKKHPFIVSSSNQEVEVLGTHFNINAYPNEGSVKTTLLEGSVSVQSTKGPERILKPNQQSVNKGDDIAVRQVDPEMIIDWKNGYFIFKGEDFKTAMRKVARWYNVEFVYDPSVSTDIEPGGWISRSSDIRTMLNRIEMTSGIHFKMEGRRIRVTK